MNQFAISIENKNEIKTNKQTNTKTNERNETNFT